MNEHPMLSGDAPAVLFNIRSSSGSRNSSTTQGDLELDFEDDEVEEKID